MIILMVPNTTSAERISEVFSMHHDSNVFDDE